MLMTSVMKRDVPILFWTCSQGIIAVLENSPSYQVAGLAITELSCEALARKQIEDPQLADLQHYLLDGAVFNFNSGTRNEYSD